MILGNKIRSWAFPVVASLLLHLPLVMLLMVLPPRKPVAEPDLTVVLRIAPSARKAAAPQQTVTEPPRKTKKEAGKAKRTPAQAAVKSTEEPASLQKIPPVESAGTADETIRTDGSALSSEADETSSLHSDNAAQTAPVELDTLQVTKKITPYYPSSSRKRKEEGTVKIIVTVKNGAVIKADVIEPSKFERLDGSALRAVKQWRFNRKDEIRVIIPFVFSLTD